MIADVILPALIVIGVLIVLMAGGLIVEMFTARKEGREPMVVRHRPRFVQTIIRATIRRHRDKDVDPRGGPQQD